MDDEAIQYMLERRRHLGGFLPERRSTPKPLTLPEPKAYEILKKGSGTQHVASTMAFVRLLKDLIKDKEFGKRIVPIIPRRGPHVRSGRDLPPQREDLQHAGAELPRRGP